MRVRAENTSWCRNQYLNVHEKLEDNHVTSICNSNNDIHLMVKGCELYYQDDYKNCNKMLSSDTKEENKEIISGNNDTTNSCTLKMQGDGNLVFYKSTGHSLWKTKTRGGNPELYIPERGGVVLKVPIFNFDKDFKRDGTNWSKPNDNVYCKGNKLKNQDILMKNEYICGSRGESFGINGDGYLVASSCKNCEEEKISLRSSSNPSSACYLRFQEDGNLIFYDIGQQIIWQSNTKGENSWVEFTHESVNIMTYVVESKIMCSTPSLEEAEHSNIIKSKISMVRPRSESIVTNLIFNFLSLLGATFLCMMFISMCSSRLYSDGGIDESGDGIHNDIHSVT